MNSMYVVTFNSTHYAITTEKLLKEEKLEIMTIPSPREITVSCGLSIRFLEKDLEKIKELITENGIDIFGIFKIEKEENQSTRIATKVF